MAGRQRIGGGRRGPSSVERASQPWLMTFADIVLLLLCFFVFMFSIARPENQQIQDALRSFREHLRKGPAGPQTARAFAATTYEQPIELYQLWENKPEQEVALMEKGRGIQVQGRIVYFAHGSAELTPAIQSQLRKHAAQVRGFREWIEVRGHVAMGETADSWELAWARARAVGLHLIAVGKINERRVRLVSSGDVEPARASTGVQDQPDDAADRRVEILVTNERIR